MKLTSRRYIGSKTKLLDWIFSKIDNNTKGNSFLDIFSGTGVVAEQALSKYNKVIVNDILLSNKVIYEAFWSDEAFDLDKILKYQKKFNNIKKYIKENYFSYNYGDKYFGINDAKKIGYIREEIEMEFSKQKINKKEFNILLASLIYSLDKIANTVGHYEAYRKIKVEDDRFIFRLIDVKNYRAKEILIYRKDANELAREIEADIEVYDIEMDSLIEVTLMKNRQQATNEIPAITRHLKEQRDKSKSANVFSIFVAPNIHADTIYVWIY